MGVTQVADVKPLFYQQNHKEKLPSTLNLLKGSSGRPSSFEELNKGTRFSEQVHDCVNLLKLEPGTLLGHRGGFFTDGELIFQGFNEYLMKRFAFYDCQTRSQSIEPIIGFGRLSKRVEETMKLFNFNENKFLQSV